MDVKVMPALEEVPRAIPWLMVGGGGAYYGPTAERDKKVIAEVARRLFVRIGNTLGIITGGTPGIPMDFAKAWIDECGHHYSHVSFITTIHWQPPPGEETLLGVEYNGRGETEHERRIALLNEPGIACAFFAQGGKHTTAEMLMCTEKNIPVVAWAGSGGAAGGQIAYNDNSYVLGNDLPDWIIDASPDANVTALSVLLAARLETVLAPRLPVNYAQFAEIREIAYRNKKKRRDVGLALVAGGGTLHGYVEPEVMDAYIARHKRDVQAYQTLGRDSIFAIQTFEHVDAKTPPTEDNDDDE